MLVEDNMDTICVLLVDDEVELVKAFKTKLENDGMEVSVAHTAAEGLALLKKRSFDVTVFDIRLPDQDGVELLKMAKTIQPTVETIMLTGYATVESAIQSMKLGAYDYLKKPCELAELTSLVEKAYEKRALSQSKLILEEHLRILKPHEQILGESEKIKKIKELIGIAATSDIPVLVQGETGTGKELVANTIHGLSARKDGQFVAINASNLQDNILESELFGYKKGAFTGAEKDKMGLLEIANKGTFFMDEVAEMNPSTQAKLLRVLDRGIFRKLGDIKEIQVDVRFVCASNISLKTAMKENRFRKDLYYRLNNFTIFLPSLLERKDDIPLLAEHFLQKHKKRQTKKKFAKEVMELFKTYPWPGNVRELSNVVERACLLSGERQEIDVNDLPIDLLSTPDKLMENTEVSSSIPPFSLDEQERDLIQRTLRLADGNKAKAARLLGIARKTLYEKLKRS
jgi:two-component system, NtrC family, response regulator AtoC